LKDQNFAFSSFTRYHPDKNEFRHIPNNHRTQLDYQKDRVVKYKSHEIGVFKLMVHLN